MSQDVLQENDQRKDDHLIDIHLSRLGIAFRYHINKNRIISREYPDMCVEQNQSFGTLTGLLLSPSTENQYHIFRKVIIPYGHLLFR